MRTKVIGLLALLLLIVGAWTFAWVRIRDDVMANVDAGIADLRDQGVVVICPDRTVSGWPFRVSVTCREPEVRLPDGSRVTAGAIESNGAIDDPALIVTRVAAPVAVVAADGTEVDATFSALTFSYRADETGGPVPQIAVLARDLAANALIKPQGIDLGRLTAAAAEAHLRPSGTAGDVDVAITLTGAEAMVATRDVLPVPADAGLLMTLRQVTAATAGPAEWAAAGGEIALTQAALEMAGARLEASGHASLDAGGQIAGEATVIGSGLEKLSQLASSGKPLPPALAALATALSVMGRPSDTVPGARAIEIRAADGSLTANGLPLGSAPGLF